MKIDFADVFASGIGFIFKQIFLLLVAIWAGCTAGAISLIATEVVASGKLNIDSLAAVVTSPVLLLSIWIIPNILLLGVAAFLFFHTEAPLYVNWGVVVGLEAVLVIAGNLGRVADGWLSLSVAWIACVILLGMVGTGLWFLRQWHINRWANELTMLKAENAVRRTQLKEAFGTHSVGNDEWSLD